MLSIINVHATDHTNLNTWVRQPEGFLLCRYDNHCRIEHGPSVLRKSALNSCRLFSQTLLRIKQFASNPTKCALNSCRLCLSNPTTIGEVFE